MRRMLYAAEPISTAAELEEARALADDFASGIGRELHEALVQRDKSRYSSFISEPWFELYLRDRRPLLLNHNPQLTFKDEEGAGRGTQPGRAARLLHAAMTFMRTLESGNLTPDVFHTNPRRSKTAFFEEAVRLLPQGIAFYGAAACGAFPLDMSQYANLFRSTRVPKPGIDELVVAPSSSHVVVQRAGRFWRLPVLDAEGGTVPQAQLEQALMSIVQQADASPALPEESVGVLTTLGRDRWTQVRATIAASSAANVATLGEIDSALFVLGLDTDSPEDDIAVGRCFLHGSGLDRWMDKSFNLMVSANGKAAINFEHAWGDGVAVLRFFDEVHAAAAALPVIHTPEAPTLPPTPLSFDLTAEVKEAIREAKSAFDATVARTDAAGLRTDMIDSGLLKRAKLSPDGTMQMAFQLAHVHMHGGPLPSTYESASTAAFKHGRTETIRSATPEAAAFTTAFTTPSSSVNERLAALRTAVDNHSRITREALMGKGMDRHLFALDYMAKLQVRTHPLFSCAAVAKLRHIVVSTSTLNSDALANGGFGPVNDDCYAVGYGIRSSGSECAIMSYGRDAQGFVDCLEKAYGQMREVALHAAAEQ